jgi:hypothetical protein
VVFKNCRDHSSVGRRGSLLRKRHLVSGKRVSEAERSSLGGQRASGALARPDLKAFIAHFRYGIHRHLQGRGTISRRYGIPSTASCRCTTTRRFRCRSTNSWQIRRFEKWTTIRLDASPARKPDLGSCTGQMLQTAKDHLERDFAVVGVTSASSKRWCSWARSLAGTSTASKPTKEREPQPIAEHGPVGIHSREDLRTYRIGSRAVQLCLCSIRRRHVVVRTQRSEKTSDGWPLKTVLCRSTGSWSEPRMPPHDEDQ